MHTEYLSESEVKLIADKKKLYQARWRAKHLDRERQKGKERQRASRKSKGASERMQKSSGITLSETDPIERRKEYQRLYSKLPHRIAGRKQQALKRKSWILAHRELSSEDVNFLQSACRHCFYCGRVKSLTVDHKLALAMGGKHTRGNVVLACGSCNSSKGVSPFNEFLSKSAKL